MIPKRADPATSRDPAPPIGGAGRSGAGRPGGATPVIDARGLDRDYVVGVETVRALRGLSLRADRNEYVAIMGPSGSGKSTLLDVIGRLDTPTAGDDRLNGTPVSRLSDRELARVRNRDIGFVFQTFSLLADEPTGNPDTRTGEDVMALFDELHAGGQTILLVSHEADVAAHARRRVLMRDGRIESDGPVGPDPAHVASREVPS